MSDPAQSEIIALASGERRQVTIEKTTDKEWDSLVLLIEGATSLLLDQKDLTHLTIAAIADLRAAHNDDWQAYCENRGIKWHKQIKSPFQPLVMWILKQAKERTGENHTSKASMIVGCLDEYWEIERPNGMTPGGIPEWLESKGGYSKVYRDRLERFKEPTDKKAERYSRCLSLPLREEHEIPECAGDLDGEVLLLAHIDRKNNTIEYISAGKPKETCHCLDQFLRVLLSRAPVGQSL